MRQDVKFSLLFHKKCNKINKVREIRTENKLRRGLAAYKGHFKITINLNKI